MVKSNSNSLVHQCLDILKSENIKKELKVLFRPVIDIIMTELNPYIYIISLLLISIFLLNLGIFLLFLNKFNQINFATSIFSHLFI
jgi:hypothetical protein